MEILEYFYDNRPNNAIYYPRKIEIPKNGDIYLYGAASVGKTSLLLDYIDSLNAKTLYIDCQDPVFILEDIDINTMNDFIKESEITLLILDHWYEGFFNIRPNVDRVILCSREYIPSFSIEQSLLMHPLDYEEFLGFGKNGTAESQFNRFLKLGTIPSVASSKTENATLALRSIFYERFSEQESRLLPILSIFQGKRVNSHQIYTTAREYFKISKDWTYKTLNKFKNEGIIIFIDDINGGRRMFIYDFALTRYLNHRQPFAVTFDAMVALALYKHGKYFKSIDRAYILSAERELIISAPFEPQDMIIKRLQKIKKKILSKGIKKISVATVSTQYTIEMKDFFIEALPFYEWSILND